MAANASPTGAADAAPAPKAGGNTKTVDGAPLSEQVSFVINHHVKPGHHEEYERWLHVVTAEAAKYRGHMGTHIARPAPGGDIYEIAVRFANRPDADAWINSQTRKDLVKRIESMIVEPEKLKVKSGIDYWFTSVTEGAEPPPRWKQWLTTVSVIWPLSMVLPLILGRLFRAVPILGTFGVAQLISALCMVGLLVYVIMPRYTRLLEKWLTK